MTRQMRISLVGIFALGLMLRLLYLLSVPALPGGGGDAYWYMANGIGIWNGDTVGTALDLPYNTALLPTAPLFLFIAGFWPRLLGLENGVLVIRLIHIGCTLVTIWLAYDMTVRITQQQWGGIFLAALLSLSPVLIIEPVQITTETLYVLWIIAGVAAYVRAVEPDTAHPFRWLLLCGALLGLATLTRAVSLLFPIGLMGHWLLVQGWQQWRKGLVGAILLLIVYSGTVSTWTVHNWVNNQRFVIASSELMAAIWRGAVPVSGSPQENDAILGNETPAEQVTDILQSDTSGYLQRRGSQLLAAYLQPHGVLELGGESLRTLALTWLRDDVSLEGLGRLLNGDFFWPKLAIYLWHYMGILLGVVGIWLSRAKWRLTLPLIGFIVYTTLIHSVLLALPRYIFPTHIFFWCFGAIALAHLLTRQRTNT